MFLNPFTMKNTWLLSLLLLVFGGASYAQTDDLYYDPDMDATSTVAYTEEYPDDNYGYDDEAYDYYDDYDYYYTQRIRRFYHPTAGFGFYSPYFVDYNFYDPYYNNYRSGINLNLYFGSRYYRPSLMSAWNPFGYRYGWSDPFYSPWNYSYMGYGYGRYGGFYSPFYSPYSSFGYYGSGWNTWCGPSYAYSPYGYYGSFNSYTNRNFDSGRGSYYGSRRIGVNDRGTVVSTPRRTNNGLNPGLSTANRGTTIVNRRSDDGRSGISSPRTQTRSSDQNRVYNTPRRTGVNSGTNSPTARPRTYASPRTQASPRSNTPRQVTPRSSNTPTYRSGSSRTSSSPAYRRSTTSSPRTYNSNRPSYTPRSSSPSMSRSGSTYRPSAPTHSSSPSVRSSAPARSSTSSPRSGSSNNSPRRNNDQ